MQDQLLLRQFHSQCQTCMRVIYNDQVDLYFKSREGQAEICRALHQGPVEFNPFDIFNKPLLTVYVELKCNHCSDNSKMKLFLESEPILKGHHMERYVATTYLFEKSTGIILFGCLPSKNQFDPSAYLRAHDHHQFRTRSREQNLVGRLVFIGRLLIIAQAYMRGGVCYMGYCLEEKKFYRPIYNMSELFWPFATDMTPGCVYGLRGSCTATTPLPHQHDDLIMDTHFLTPYYRQNRKTDSELFIIISNVAKNTLAEIFVPVELKTSGHKKYYVEEGDNCSSVGLLSLNASKLEFVQDGEKTRINVKDGTGVVFSLPWKSTEPPPALSKETDDEDVLILVGLSRGFKGSKEIIFPEKRCYLLALTLLRNI